MVDVENCLGERGSMESSITLPWKLPPLMTKAAAEVKAATRRLTRRLEWEKALRMASKSTCVTSMFSPGSQQVRGVSFIRMRR